MFPDGTNAKGLTAWRTGTTAQKLLRGDFVNAELKHLLKKQVQACARNRSTVGEKSGAEGGT